MLKYEGQDYKGLRDLVQLLLIFHLKYLAIETLGSLFWRNGRNVSWSLFKDNFETFEVGQSQIIWSILAQLQIELLKPRAHKISQPSLTFVLP